MIKICFNFAFLLLRPHNSWRGTSLEIKSNISQNVNLIAVKTSNFDVVKGSPTFEFNLTTSLHKLLIPESCATVLLWPDFTMEQCRSPVKERQQRRWFPLFCSINCFITWRWTIFCVCNAIINLPLMSNSYWVIQCKSWRN